MPVSMAHLGARAPLMPAVSSLDDDRLGGGRRRKRNSQTCDQQTDFLHGAPFLQSEYKPRAAFAFCEERLLARAATWRDDAGGFRSLAGICESLTRSVDGSDYGSADRDESSLGKRVRRALRCSDMQRHLFRPRRFVLDLNGDVIDPEILPEQRSGLT